jgi:hypothetical protein
MLVHVLQPYRCQPFVCIVIDAGTIHRHRFLDLVLLLAVSTIPLLFYDAIDSLLDWKASTRSRKLRGRRLVPRLRSLGSFAQIERTSTRSLIEKR